MRLTPPTSLSDLFCARVDPHLEQVAAHPFFRHLEEASATLAQCRKALLGFYPLVESFPRYMALVLARIGSHDAPRAADARGWLMRNIKTEEAHARWFVEWGRPIGLGPDDFAAARPTARMDAQNCFLYRTAATVPIAEAVAAVNYAVEGATGIWTRRVRPALPEIARRHGLALDDRALRWILAHADYDDTHPREALEVIKIFARDEGTMARAAEAANRSLEYFSMALDDVLESAS